MKRERYATTRSTELLFQIFSKEMNNPGRRQMFRVVNSWQNEMPSPEKFAPCMASQIERQFLGSALILPPPAASAASR